MIHLNDSNHQSKDISMKEDKLSEDDGCKNNQNILDIQTTIDNRPANEILKLINKNSILIHIQL